MASLSPIMRHRIVETTVKEELAKPYVFGQSDCFALGCRVADALDPSLDLCGRFLGTYDSLRGAHKALRREGYASLDAFLASLLEPCAPAAARLGDLAVVQIGKAQHLAVCLTTRFVSKEESGRLYFTVEDCIAAYRTGD